LGGLPRHVVSHWGIDPQTGEQVKITYAERFSRQYQQFKAHSTQTKSGTPINHAPFLTRPAALNCARRTSTPSRRSPASMAKSSRTWGRVVAT